MTNERIPASDTASLTPGQDEIRAYELSGRAPMPIVPASAFRSWMRDTTAHQCLPLRIASQHGWLVLNPHPVVAIWDGGTEPSALQLRFPEGGPPYAAVSHFGHGIVSWPLPYVFQTPPGIALLIRGPANMPIDGAAPLEGIIETDWAAIPPPMSWQITKADEPIYFAREQPICMLVPVQLGLIEAFRPTLRFVDDDAKVRRDAEAAMQAQNEGLRATLVDRNPTVTRAGRYFEGRTQDGEYFDNHRRRLTVRPFRRP